MVAPEPAEGSVGIVAPQHLMLPDGLTLACGARLAPVEITYETYGTLAPTRDNVILLCHALSGGSHAAGKHHPDDRKPGWWDLYVGPGKALDTEWFFVICVNVLASPYGTTSPLSINPATGEPYGLTFPPVAVSDWVELERAVLEQLGIERLYAVVGGSTGGMRAFEWAVRYPERVQKAIVIAAPARSSPMVIALNHIQRQTILMGLMQGGEQGAQRGLALARMLGHISYLSEDALWRKFGREAYPEPDFWGVTFQMESYLEYKASTFVKRFDPYCYLYITRAMDTYDLAATYGEGDLSRALSRVRAQLQTKHRFKLSNHSRFDLAHRHGRTEQTAHGGHAPIGNPARHNQPKQAEIVVHIQREAVHTDPAGDLDADGGDFLVAHPDACIARRTPCHDAIFAQRTNQYLLQLA